MSGVDQRIKNQIINGQRFNGPPPTTYHLPPPSIPGTAGEENVELSFFTAGTGNAGATIVSATFLLLAQKALTYAKG